MLNCAIKRLFPLCEKRCAIFREACIDALVLYPNAKQVTALHSRVVEHGAYAHLLAAAPLVEHELRVEEDRDGNHNARYYDKQLYDLVELTALLNEVLMQLRDRLREGFDHYAQECLDEEGKRANGSQIP